MASRPTAAQRRHAALRSALDEQLAALGDPPYSGPDLPAPVLSACARALLRAHRGGLTPHRPAVKAVVRATLAELAARHPGQALEVRVPPYGAVQCLAGPRHTRGTPPGVVETDPLTWTALVVGEITWADSVASHRVSASGVRADLSPVLPLWPGPDGTPPRGSDPADSH
ncbi:MAG TPA: sterol carrier family protein [Thermobifida alba]|nr:sterol carrier family protein [Thermobifida alba]